MGVTIWYNLRLKSDADIEPFLAAAKLEARGLGWRVRRTNAGSQIFAASPHSRCEDVCMDFSEGTEIEHFVKTAFAPIDTHIQVVSFLRKLEPLAASLEVDDEGEYWQTGDIKILEKHRGEFETALSSFEDTGEHQPTVFTCGGIGATIQGPNGPVVVWINPPYVNNDTDPSTITAEFVASLPPGAVEYPKHPKR